jgi:hypothetical protein
MPLKPSEFCGARFARMLLLIPALASYPVHGTPDAERQMALLTAISEDDGMSDYQGTLSRHAKLAVEMGAAAIPVLADRMQRTRNAGERINLENSIAYIGGPQAVAVLEQETQTRPTPIAQMIFAFSIPSAPSGALNKVLIQYLNGPQTGTEWSSIQQAAYSLGIMRVRAAVPALQSAATKPGGGGTAAREALHWMARPGLRARFQASTPNDDLLQAILAAGLPDISRSDSWCESHAKQRNWKKTPEVWIVRSGCPVGPAGHDLSVDAFNSPDGTRAIVAIGMKLGPNDGVGFTYLLRRVGRSWKVVGLQPTWVS